MKDFQLKDGTVNFLPNRLNHQPVIVRGLTADELWITVGITGVAGLFLGIAIALMTGQIGMAPTTVLVSITLGIFVGGGMLRRKKRGRPDTWLYRQIQWLITCHYPTLGAFIGGAGLINRSDWWEVKRLAKRGFSPKQRRPGIPGKNRKKETK